MNRSVRNALLAKRGWGPLLLDKINAEVEKVLRRQSAASAERSLPKQRDDDIPLFDESSSDN